MPQLEFCESWQWFKASPTGVPSSDPTNGVLVFSRYNDLVNSGVTFFEDGFGKYALIGANASLFKTMTHNAGWTIGFRFMCEIPTQLWTAYNNADPLGNVTVNDDGTLSLYAGGSSGGNPLVATSNFAIHFGKWNYCEVSIELSGSTPVHAAMKLKINGQLLIDSGADTLHAASGLTSGTATINRHALTGACNYRDIVYRNVANTFGGDVKILAVRPDGDVVTDFTATGGATHFDQVNEEYSDFDTTTVKSANVGDKDIYDWQDIPGFSGTIQGVQISVLAKKDDEGLRTFKTVTGDTGSELQSDEFFLSDDYVCYHTPQDVDPATGVPYTRSGFNAKRFGIQLTA